MKSGKYRNVLSAVNHYFVFFLLMAFVITCSVMLFVSVMSEVGGVLITEENISFAAKVTFVNVLFLSLLLTAVDIIRRRLAVDRPVRQITDAAKKIMQGDFTARIPVDRSYGTDGEFAEIAECFNKMAEELSGIETLRTDFIANVSHELKTPLSVIQNYSTMLSSPDLTEEEKREYANVIRTASGNLSSLISNILKLNKLENQKIYPSSSVYDLGEQLCECLLGFEATWEKKEIELETALKENILVKTDREMMTLVWNNLFSNAFKFTEKGGKVAVRLSASGAYAKVEVEDTGCGISPEVGAHMFEKFYQGDTSHSVQGNGLGLTLVKRVVDITGSEISVSSVLGQGTVFTVKIRKEPDGTH